MTCWFSGSVSGAPEIYLGDVAPVLIGRVMFDVEHLAGSNDLNEPSSQMRECAIVAKRT
jgi:hypothetical protein